MSGELLLALETSCDETAAAVVRGRGALLSSVVASQAATHAAYGGVVPEVASRNHLAAVHRVASEALERAGCGAGDIGVFAATTGPGLASALLVGAAAAKGLALALGRPFLAVNHIEGHLLSPFAGADDVPPFLGLVASGGHTLLVDASGPGRYRLVGRTLDDAAGEAFDKVAKLLGLGYPGGPAVEAEARRGDPARFAFPRAMMCSGGHDFSFSGLKTAVRYLLPRLAAPDRPDVCAGFQEAVVDVLVRKTLDAAQRAGRDLVAVSGGVGLNARLRAALGAGGASRGVRVVFAPPALCSDNAAMIAFAAAQRRAAGAGSGMGVDVTPSLEAEFFA